MAARPEGTPCWADAMFTDLEGAKAFYGDVLGWTFGESKTEFGSYTEAYKDGQAVAAVVPPMPGSEGEQSAWCLYFASTDAAATAQKIRDNQGTLLMEPMQVSDFGTMVLAQDPTGVRFGVWQAGSHEGFAAQNTVGSYAWAEIYTREPEKSDAFFSAVFPYRAQSMADDTMDFKVFQVGDDTVLGRMKMTDDFPPDVRPYINVYFGVEDCDAAVSKATKRGAKLHFGPMDSPFGRFAALTDSQGAAFSVINLQATKGDMPQWTDA